MLVAEQNLAIREQLRERISDARERSDALFAMLRPQAIYERPIPERHRLIFYLGHLEAFDWNLLGNRVFGTKTFNPDFDRLFAFGIDPVGGGLPNDEPSDWPSLAAVPEYVQKIRSTLDEELRGAIFRSNSQSHDGTSLDLLLNVAIEHRLMHLETLAYMLHQLPFDKKIAQASATVVTNSPVQHRMVEIPEGEAALGISRQSEAYGWDNEFERHTVPVPAFEIDEFMVTNQQYLDFIAAGGYETRGYWNDADWNWKTSNQISHPVFWKQKGDRWVYRSMFEEVPLPLDWPVYVSHAEASAYARWAGKSLPTEAEWHRAAYATSDGSDRDYPWGNEAPGPNLVNADFVRWDPVPVNALPAAQSAFGVHGMVGNGWEWTSTVFAPFAGFDPFPFYRGYSADFFDGKHFVMKGGSARTAGCMLRPSFRNWFQPHYQYVYAGFRLVRR
jgi:gamma-glutamyl hercynylcysteine S-oxide synthase